VKKTNRNEPENKPGHSVENKEPSKMGSKPFPCRYFSAQFARDIPGNPREARLGGEA
jgi:hypothetical protein